MWNIVLYHTPLFYLIQPIWRDEAFSYFLASAPIEKIILTTAHDFNPPLYYMLLHYWIALVGHSDSGLRLLSFLFHLITVYFSYLIGKKLSSSSRRAWFLAACMFFNPMLLYYAFEMRMYALYATCTIASVYFLLQKNWRAYTVACVLGLFTHSFFVFLPISYAVAAFFYEKKKKEMIIHLLQPLLFFLPWMPVLALQFSQSKDSWIYPVNLQVVLSSLGNIFTAYEGTPNGWWQLTSMLSGIILLFCLIASRRHRPLNRLLLFPLLIPLALVLGYSMIVRSIYVNRYLISLTIFEVIGIAAGIAMIRHRIARSIAATLWIVLIIGIDLAAPSSHKKTDFRITFQEINKLAHPDDTVYTKTPISVLESAYYYRYPDQVFVYNPHAITIPNYIGVTLVFPNVSRPALPEAPSTTYLVGDDATYDIIVNQ